MDKEWIDVKTAAGILGISRATLFRHLKVLEQSGAVRVWRPAPRALLLNESDVREWARRRQAEPETGDKHTRETEQG